MPHMCFSYPTDVPVGPGNRDAARAVPRDPREVGYPYFSYPQSCLGYPDDIRLGAGNRDAAQPDLRRMPISTCFRY
jgi:hypothetical protein